MATELVEITDGNMKFNFHSGQKKAWKSDKRFICVLAGTQGGKTVMGPPWLLREIFKRGPGDYMVVTPTYKLLDLKALPTFCKLFEKTLNLGEFVGYRNKFVFSEWGKRKLFGENTDVSEDTIVYFGHAADSESLESATAKAAWLDEVGQTKFRLGSWEAILRRLSVHMGRVLLTTTPYACNWLKQKFWDPWERAYGDHPEIEVIRFDSTLNPAFPKEEFERARRDLPLWKFDLFYKAIFTRPAGLIYDCFDPKRHKVSRFEIPKTWQTFLGLDFGGIHTAGIFLAENPMDKSLWAYREYPAHEGSGSRFDGITRTARQHVEALLAGEHKLPIAVGGARSEQNWREEFRQAGLPVQEPEIMDSTANSRNSSSVEVGISRVYSAIRRNELFFFEDLHGILDELESYSRVTNERGEVSDEIEDKASWHGADALRYIIGHLRRPMDSGFRMGSGGSIMGTAPRNVFSAGGGDEKCFDKNMERRRRQEGWDDVNW